MRRSKGGEIHVLIVAGGSGNRMGNPVPKQFMMLAGKSVLWHAINCFSHLPQLTSLTISGHPEWLKRINEILLKFDLPNAKCIPGGTTRQISCKNGLDHIKADPRDIVLIHDAARPFVRRNIIDKVISATQITGGSIPAIPIPDSMIQFQEGFIVDYPDRNQYKLVQTPQGFWFERIKEAHSQAAADGVINATDDASLLLNQGFPVTVIDGDPLNIKITTPSDLEFAEEINNTLRSGGY